MNIHFSYYEIAEHHLTKCIPGLTFIIAFHYQILSKNERTYNRKNYGTAWLFIIFVS